MLLFNNSIRQAVLNLRVNMYCYLIVVSQNSIIAEKQGSSKVAKPWAVLHVGRGGVILHRGNNFSRGKYSKFCQILSIFTKILPFFRNNFRIFFKDFEIFRSLAKIQPNSLGKQELPILSHKGSGRIGGHPPKQAKFPKCMRKNQWNP